MHYGKWFASLLFAAVSILSTAAFANTTDTDNDGVLDIATWVQRGSDIDGEAAGDLSGCSVSLSADGSVVAIGASGNDGNGIDSGHVRLYAWDGSSWVQRGSDIDGEAADDYSGSSVSLSADGSVVAIGAYGNDGNGIDAGHVRLYAWNGSSWVQRGSDIDGEAADDYSGCRSRYPRTARWWRSGLMATTVMAAMQAMCGSMLGMVRAGCSAGLTSTVRRRMI